MIRLKRVGSELPRGITLLRVAAREEGFRSIERLLDARARGAARFERDDEALLGAAIPS